MDRSKRWEIERKLAAMLDEVEGRKEEQAEEEQVSIHTVITFTPEGLEGLASLGSLARANVAHANYKRLFKDMSAALLERGILMRAPIAKDPAAMPSKGGRFRVVRQADWMSPRTLDMLVTRTMVDVMDRIMTRIMTS